MAVGGGLPVDYRHRPPPPSHAPTPPLTAFESPPHAKRRCRFQPPLCQPAHMLIFWHVSVKKLTYGRRAHEQPGNDDRAGTVHDRRRCPRTTTAGAAGRDGDRRD